MNTHERITYIGYTDWRRTYVPFGIKYSDRFQHIYAVGKTGMGKSTLLSKMAIQDCYSTDSVIVIDPHGDTAIAVFQSIPEHRKRDVIYFDATDPHGKAQFNPLAYTDTDTIHLLASEIVASFKRQWHDSWGVRMEYILRYCILTLLHVSGTTLQDIQPLLTNKQFRETLLGKIRNDSIRNFWELEFNKFSPSLRQDAISAILNKSGVFHADVTLAQIIGNKEGINLTNLIDNGSILIVNLSRGQIGDLACSLLGSLLLSTIQMAMMRQARRSYDDRRACLLYVDEAQLFVNKGFAQMLSECRKYKLALYLTNQYLDQLPEDVQAAILGNVGTLITFNLGIVDAMKLSPLFYPDFSKDDFLSLGRFQVYIKLLIEGVVSKGFSAIIKRPT